jgi:hypothetical protein
MYRAVDAGVVHEDIDPVCRGDRSGESGVDRGVVGHIRLLHQSRGEACRCRVERRRIEVPYDDTSSLGRKSPRDAESDTADRARHPNRACTCVLPARFDTKVSDNTFVQSTG